MNPREKVLKVLEELDISYDIFDHPPVPTVEEALPYWKEIDATHCKNLFFRNHKGNKHYLVILKHEQKLVRDSKPPHLNSKGQYFNSRKEQGTKQKSGLQ